LTWKGATNERGQPKPYIVAERVCKSFGTHQVLKDVSTVFNTGEVTVIIGASGSGKSTLLRAINRLEPHDSGRITIDGVRRVRRPATCSASAARWAWCSSSSTCSAT
jgi:ABC-type polar amino acid transport system ATPase subunit